MNVLFANFTYSSSDADMQTEAVESAAFIREVPGCLEKAYIIDPEVKRVGGVYKFADRASVEGYRLRRS